MSISNITPCLWFNGQAEEAAQFYASIFKDSNITRVQRWTDEAGQSRVIMASFTLNNQPFTALNGGPQFTFNEAISFQIDCADQEEVDHYWTKLSEGGDESKQRCGWLADKFGVSWQVVPREMKQYLGGSDAEGARRAREAMMGMKKLVVAELKKAYEGK